MKDELNLSEAEAPPPDQTYLIRLTDQYFFKALVPVLEAAQTMDEKLGNDKIDCNLVRGMMFALGNVAVLTMAGAKCSVADLKVELATVSALALVFLKSIEATEVSDHGHDVELEDNAKGGF